MHFLIVAWCVGAGQLICPPQLADGLHHVVAIRPPSNNPSLDCVTTAYMAQRTATVNGFGNQRVACETDDGNRLWPVVAADSMIVDSLEQLHGLLP